MEVQLCAAIFLLLTTITFLAKGAEEGSLNQFCNRAAECGSYGYICFRNGTCQCDRWYIPNKIRNSCVGDSSPASHRGVGQRCKYDDHCIDGAFCEFQSKCRCKDNLDASENGLVCSSSQRYTLNRSHVYTVSLAVLVLGGSFTIF